MFTFLKKLFYIIILNSLLTLNCFAISKAEVIQAIIKEARINYTGNCPCPYNLDVVGRKCGRRSSYMHKKKRKIKICFESDITPDILTTYLKTHHLVIN